MIANLIHFFCKKYKKNIRKLQGTDSLWATVSLVIQKDAISLFIKKTWQARIAALKELANNEIPWEFLKPLVSYYQLNSVNKNLKSFYRTAANRKHNEQGSRLSWLPDVEHI